MLVNCNSCQKKFIVPDNAIMSTGRLVQCGYCQNKWTQYPAEKVELKKTKSIKKKVTVKKKGPKKNLYTPEYLKKKHGLDINSSKNHLSKKLEGNNNRNNNFGFYSYVIILLVCLISFYGVLNLTKEKIILKYPSSEIYINYFYDVIDIIAMSIVQFIN